MFIRNLRSKSLAQLSDEQLMAGYRASGNPDAVSELFGRYLHLVHAMCMKYADDPEDRSDLVMVIFEKVMTELTQSEVINFNTWLFSLSRNACVSWFRQQQRYASNVENWGAGKKNEDWVVENEASERLYDEQDALETKLSAAIEQLDERQRVCIHLFFFEKKSYKDIAEHTGFDVSDVKSYLQNGKRRLKGLLIPDS
ncbi:MAG: sigma-70 family RNA polymerase sigma factor [Saprospiraceae bacterium]|jgi:RNA polymerase sigma-70 factor (ECF subfamily)|nr:sigma-70 family RNA polymerase sigma factor [Saprospiraceae bacterium]HRD80968.1 sigma-70 family RNA polymerase sigma factor [Saprospiraceae bacterium]HRK83664.1 sigma-70 family RNA polymerase sigma factor [Saprospiraceae bacterium]